MKSIAKGTKCLQICQVAGAVAVLVFFAVACSQPAPETQTQSTTTTVGVTTTVAAGSTPDSTPDTSTDATPDSTPDSIPAFIPVGADTPGVSDDSVTMSFIITDTSAVAAGFGWEPPDEGDREAQLRALVDHFNEQGGFAGRQIDAKIRVFNAITDGPIAEEALCNAITQDDKAFAVVLTGQLQENARPCYRNANTLMFEATLYPVDNQGFEALAPYYWSPLLPSYDDLVAGLATRLVADGWFEGATLGVIAIESELSQRVYEEQFLPRLEAAGVEVVSYNTIDPTDGTSFNNDQLQAIINFKSTGVDKVVAIGGSRLVPWFIETSITQNYAPAYAVTSYDNTEFSVFNFPEMMPGASGISVLPGFDVGDEQLSFPATAAEQECVDIFTAAGLEFEVRANVRTGLIFCDVLRLLQAASPNLREVSAQGVSEAVWQLGDTFDAAAVYGVEFNEGSYAGGDIYRSFMFDSGCECMVLLADPSDFDG